MTKQIKYWSVVLLISLIPTIGMHLILRPFWHKGSGVFIDVTTFEFVFTAVILPLYLTLTNYYLSKKYEAQLFFIINVIIISACIIMSSQLHFLNWADSIGSYKNPDNETLLIISFERTVGLTICGIAFIIIFIMFFVTKKKTKAIHTT